MSVGVAFRTNHTYEDLHPICNPLNDFAYNIKLETNSVRKNLDLTHSGAFFKQCS